MPQFDVLSRLKYQDQKPQLRLITMNIWFDSFAQEQRYQSICEMFEAKDPCIICLQEVVPNFIQLLKSYKNGFFAEKYDIQGGWDKTKYNESSFVYTTLMMVRKEYEFKFVVIPFPSYMDRTLLIGYHENIGCFATVHLATVHLVYTHSI